MTAGRRALIVVAVLFAAMFGVPWSGAVPEAAAQISVTAADPPAGEQGTLNLSVIIKGRGFKNGAKAKFFKTGTADPAGVNVKSTQFVSSTQLIANIDIADAAALSLFDIQVANTDGRTGKGTELFSVVAKKLDACSLPDPVPAAGYCYSGVPGLPGCFDTNFGDGTGMVIGPRHMSTWSHVVDGLGRIIVVGSWRDACATNPPTEWAIARYLPSGLPDESFGGAGNGLVRLAFTADNQSGAQAVLVQPDGKILVVGGAKPVRRSLGEAVAVRLNHNGTLDGSFGAGGFAWIPLQADYSWGVLEAATLQSDGRIVVAGRLGGGRQLPTPSGFLARLNVNGSLDTSFTGSGGRYVYTGRYSRPAAVTIQMTASGERIVAAGKTWESVNLQSHYSPTVWRFMLSGALDDGFGERIDAANPASPRSGFVRVFFHDAAFAGRFDDEFSDFALDPSNRVVATGYASDDFEHRLALARFDVSGDPDPTFGVGGKAAVPSGFDYTWVSGVGLPADGRILVADYSWNDDEVTDTITSVGGIWRFEPDGKLDSAFGVEGRVLNPIAAGARIFSSLGRGLSVLPDGTVVWTGALVMDGTPRITFGVIARYWQ